MLETQFYIRFVLNIIFGMMFVYALVRMAKHNNCETTPQRHTAMKVFGGIFVVLSVLCLIGCVAQLFALTSGFGFPTHMQPPPLGKYPIVRHSFEEICWGYPTPRQFAVLSSILGIFTMLGLAGYFFYYRSSKSSFGKKLGKFLTCSLLLVFLYSATNFQYFDFWEFISPLLFFCIWIYIMSRTTPPEGAKSSNESNIESSATEMPPKGHRLSINPGFFETPKTISQGIDKSTIEGEWVQSKSKIPSIDFQDEQTKESVKQIYRTPPSDKDSFCSYCGTKVEPTALFCTYCGRKLRKSSSVCSPKSNRKCNKLKIRKGVNIISITLGGIILLAALSMGVWYYFDEIRPQRKADKIFASEKSALDMFAGTLLFDKCKQIIRDHDIPKCGDEGLDHVNLQKLSSLAWDKMKQLSYAGYASAQFELALLYNGYDFINQEWNRREFPDGSYLNPNLDYDKAAFWYLQAAKQGCGAAQANLGSCYEHGRGVSENVREAIKWYRRAAANNNSYGELKLGDWFQKGESYTSSFIKRWTWKKDPDAGYYNWRYKLGYTHVPEIEYSKTVIIERNMDSAIYYWERSASHGNETALERLQKIYR